MMMTNFIREGENNEKIFRFICSVFLHRRNHGKRAVGREE
jgi:hypothetical protein